MSNKTPKRIVAKKTKSAPRLNLGKNSYLLYLVLLLPIIAIFIWLINVPSETINLGGTRINIERATTQPEREKGLAGRESLQQNSGMLFVFESSDYHCFWMKDMNFAIDIIWLDENRQVVEIASSVSPSTYPETFCPSTPAKYALEVDSGLANQSGVQVGTQL